MTAATNDSPAKLAQIARLMQEQAASVGISQVKREILLATVEVLHEKIARLQDASFQRWLQQVVPDGGSSS